MFVIKKMAHRPWPVKVKTQVAGEDGAISQVEQGFVAHFKPFSEAEYEALVASAAGPAPLDPARMSVAELLQRNAVIFCDVIVGWSGVLDESGSAVPFSVDALRQLVVGPDGLAVSAGINVAISELRFGVAAAKNSPTSAEPGAAPSAAGEATSALLTSRPSV